MCVLPAILWSTVRGNVIPKEVLRFPAALNEVLRRETEGVDHGREFGDGPFAASALWRGYSEEQLVAEEMPCLQMDQQTLWDLGVGWTLYHDT